MKLKYTLFLYLLLISFISFSQQPGKGKKIIPKKIQNNKTAAQQNLAARSETSYSSSSTALTGVWRGFFTSGSGFFQEKYKYEVQIGQLNNNGIKGVTYSYKTTVFYGKANLAGMYTPSTKNLILKETKLVEVKMSGGDACLMTCYLEYSKTGNTEILEGTFTSINIQKNTDCGSGRVYLEKVVESDFYKEDFVKDFEAKKKTPAPKNSTVKTPVIKPKKEITTKEKNSTAATTGTTNNKRHETIEGTQSEEVSVMPDVEKRINKIDINPVEEPRKPLAKELRERENVVAKVIHAEGEEIQIDLYDNGQIDDDTVTVYHNKQVVAWKQRLCHQPITIKIKVDPKHSRNEFVMVADNLGTIPPNTALMVITIGKQRYDVNLTSNFQKNATIIIDCKVPSRETK